MKTTSWPDQHWHWPIELSHQHGVRSGDLVFTGGQADLDKHGNVVNPGNLQAQVGNVFSYVEKILLDLGAELDDLVRLVIYFVGGSEQEQAILESIAKRLAGRCSPTVSTISLPALCYPGMLIELEAIAVITRQEQQRQTLRLKELSKLAEGFSHVIRCDDLIFTSDVSAINPDGSVAAENDLLEQTSIMMERLMMVLDAVGATASDVLKLNVFYTGDGTADNWHKPAMVRAGYFSDPGPAATGIAVQQFAQTGLMTKIAVTAGQSTTSYSWPDNHWNWTTPLPYKHGNRHGQLIHLGGQVALDSRANVLHPGDIVAQTSIALDNIAAVLQDLGATMDDVVKVTTFYQGTASAEALHQNLIIRSKAFTTPGPATSGIPVPHLVYEDMMIEIEIIAMVEGDGVVE